MIDITSNDGEFQKHIAHFEDELRTIRTGRAHSSIVEHMLVDCYDARMPLKGLASVSIPDARTLLITPWDPSIAKEIEKAMAHSSLDAQTVIEGTSIRLILPQLTEENRRALAKTVGQKCEQTKVRVRLLRDKMRDEIVKAEKNNELTEDDRFDLQKKLDEMVREYTARADMIADEKEKEIMTV